jgi:flagellar biosynthesis/type III secretory pathway protein FliH
MSSSERLLRYSFPDLRRGAPPAAAPAFEARVTFSEVGTRAPLPPTPDEARREGFAEGERAGRAAALKELEPARDALARAARGILDARRQRIEAAEAELCDVVREIARRVLHGELAQAQDVVLRMARACVGAAAREDDCTLRVAPDDLALVRAHLPELEAELAEGALTLRPDASLAPGGVVLETPSGCYEGRPERVLDAALAEAEPEPPEGSAT